MPNCLFCGVNGELKRLAKLYHWDKPEKYDWFCEDHYGEVRSFQEQQKRGFLEHFKNPELRKLYLNDNQRALYDRLSKE